MELKDIKDYQEQEKGGRTRTDFPCIFCGEGYMLVWKNQENHYSFYCGDNYNCRYSFHTDKEGKLLDVDGFGPPDEVFEAYVKKVKFIGEEESPSSFGLEGLLTHLGFDPRALLGDIK